jgi:DNA-binding transcriptional ArsR family regulator
MTSTTTETVWIALADPTRRAIVERLTRGPSRVTDLAAPFDMSLNAVSKHIKVLEAARLVRRTREGREHTLELDPAPLREVTRWASEMDRFWSERLDRIEHFFAEKAGKTRKTDKTERSRKEK